MYEITVTRTSRTRKILEKHEYGGVVMERHVMSDFLNIARKCHGRYYGDLDISLVQIGEYADGTTYRTTLRNMFIPKGAKI